MIKINYVKETIISGPIFISKYFNVIQHFNKNICRNFETFVILEEYIPNPEKRRSATEKERTLRVYSDLY